MVVVGKSGVWICLARRALKSSLRLNKFSAMASLGSSTQQHTQTHLQPGIITNANARPPKDVCVMCCVRARMAVSKECMNMKLLQAVLVKRCIATCSSP